MTGPRPRDTEEYPLNDAVEVRAALERILALPPFLRQEAACRLLRQAVEDTLAGRICKLKPAGEAKLRRYLAEYSATHGADDPVRISLPPGCESLVFSTTLAPAARPRRRLWMMGAMALSAAIFLLWAGSWWHAYAASAQVRSLAILPFANAKPEGGAVSEGVIDALARIPGLHVSARTSAFAVQDPNDLRAIGRELGVTAVLQGSVSRSGNRWRVDVQMDRVADGYRLWQTSFDEPADKLSRVPQTLATAIAKRIQLPAPSSTGSPHVASPAAYQAYLRGRVLFSPARPQNFDQAAGLLDEATQRDPEFAAAWAWSSIVRSYRVASVMERPNREMPAARDAAERAVALDPQCGDGHLALGIVRLQYDWDWPAAKQELDRALEASPQSALTLEWHAHWLETQGRMEEAMAEMQRALDLDPLSSGLAGQVARQYLAVNQPDRALPFAQKAVDLAPEEPAPQAELAETLLRAGQKERAEQVVKDLQNAHLPPFVVPALSAQLGDPAEARRLLNDAEDMPDEQLLPFVSYVQLAAVLNDWERCFGWIEEAANERDVWVPYLRMNPLLPSSDPRFGDYLARMNLPAASH